MKIRKILFELLLMTIGTALAAYAINAFLTGNNISPGGFSGLAIILNKMLKLSIGIWIAILNFILIIISIKLFGYKIIIKTIIATILLSVFIDLFKTINTITKDLLLASVYGGIILGVGIGINIRAGSTTGGSELLAKILSYWYQKLNQVEFMLILDGIIVILNIIVFNDIDVGLYSIITIFVCNKITDVMIEGIGYSKIAYIFSEYNEKIATQITCNLERGVTFLNGKGFFYNKNTQIIMCVLKRHQIIKLKKIVDIYDKKAFIVIYDAKEVLGEGFSKYK